MFPGAIFSSKVTLDSEYIIVVVWIMLGLLQPGFDIKLFTKLLFYTFILFPDDATHQLLFTNCSCQVAPTLVSLRFYVVLCPIVLVVHVALFYLVHILYP